MKLCWVRVFILLLRNPASEQEVVEDRAHNCVISL
jgi:hypothetical protein